MNNRGFTLVEFLLLIIIMFLILFFSLSINRRELSTSLANLVNVDDDAIFAAAENYVIKENVPFNNDNYVCVTKTKLERMGYLKKTDSSNRIIKLTGSKITGVIKKIEFVNECE